MGLIFAIKMWVDVNYRLDAVVSLCAARTPSDVPYFSLGRDERGLVLGAHRYSAADVGSCAPYFPSGRSVLCVVRDPHHYCTMVGGTVTLLELLERCRPRYSVNHLIETIPKRELLERCRPHNIFDCSGEMSLE